MGVRESENLCGRTIGSGKKGGESLGEDLSGTARHGVSKVVNQNLIFSG